MKCTSCYGTRRDCLTCHGLAYDFERTRCKAEAQVTAPPPVGGSRLLSCTLANGHSSAHEAEHSEGLFWVWGEDGVATVKPVDSSPYRSAPVPPPVPVPTIPNISVDFSSTPFWVITDGDLWVGKGGSTIVFERSEAWHFGAKDDAQACLDRLGAKARERLHVLKLESTFTSTDETYADAKGAVVEALRDKKR